ncbi:hypothetical protein BGX27_005177 [Mortierella sp. AM989]|nr:hypothetical protein BGX27_005177 [Mortierella sp. AM989]
MGREIALLTNDRKYSVRSFFPPIPDRFPRVRKGENLTLCIVKSFIILVIRFSCIMGAIWYINNWFRYIKMGERRPFNILERQESRELGNPVPHMNLYSSTANRIRVTAAAFSNKTIIIPFNDVGSLVLNDTTSNDFGDEMLLINLGEIAETMSTSRTLESIRVMLTHLTPEPFYPWIQVGILNPLRTGVEFHPQDMYNQYYFRPGHYVEIRYTPMQIIESIRLDVNSTILERAKYYMGYGGQTVSYTYRSTVDSSPFPPGLYNNATTVVIVRPQANIEIISYMEEKVTFRDTMSKIGGLIGIVGSIIVFLFGASLMSPWGFIAGVPFFRKRISGSLAKAYDTDHGLSRGPFTTTFENTGSFDREVQTNEQRIILLKERIDELEMVLSEFYVDGEVFRDYAEERVKLKVERAASVSHRGNRKIDIDPYSEQQQRQTTFQRAWGNTREPLQLPSQTLIESQHQHKGQLPSPQFLPSHGKQSQENSRRDSSEPSVLAYYQQQRANQPQNRHRSESEQSLLRTVAEEEDGLASPTSERDLQGKGLLQQDHHSMHQTFLQQQERRMQQQLPSFPPRPPKGNIIPMTLTDSVEPSLLSPSPPLSHATPQSPDFDSRSAWWRSDGADRGSKLPSTATAQSLFGSPSSAGQVGNVGSQQYEHVDMSDMSRMPREP